MSSATSADHELSGSSSEECKDGDDSDSPRSDKELASRGSRSIIDGSWVWVSSLASIAGRSVDGSKSNHEGDHDTIEDEADDGEERDTGRAACYGGAAECVEHGDGTDDEGCDVACTEVTSDCELEGRLASTFWNLSARYRTQAKAPVMMVAQQNARR